MYYDILEMKYYDYLEDLLIKYKYFLHLEFEIKILTKKNLEFIFKNNIC